MLLGLGSFSKENIYSSDVYHNCRNEISISPITKCLPIIFVSLFFSTIPCLAVGALNPPLFCF